MTLLNKACRSVLFRNCASHWPRNVQADAEKSPVTTKTAAIIKAVFNFASGSINCVVIAPAMAQALGLIY